MDMVHIDGAYGEGGGQVIRTSLALAAITGRATEIVNVRAGRAKPGLQPQHLMAVQAIARLCDAHVVGAQVGSQRLSFAPNNPPRPGQYAFDIGTAGAGTLVLQAALGPLMLAGGSSHLRVTGGTHVPMAPPFEYLAHVYLPALRRFGPQVAASASRVGFYPRGGGCIEADIAPATALGPVDMTERGKLVSLTAYIITAELPDHVADRGAAAVERAMRAVGRPVRTVVHRLPSSGPGAAVVLAAVCEGGHAGFTSLGERGKPMERVADEACADFMRWWKTGAAVDEHLADQLVLPAALAAGTSRWTTPAVTEHLRTVLWVIEQYLPIRHRIDDLGDGTARVEVTPGGV